MVKVVRIFDGLFQVLDDDLQRAGIRHVTHFVVGRHGNYLIEPHEGTLAADALYQSKGGISKVFVSRLGTKENLLSRLFRRYGAVVVGLSAQLPSFCESFPVEHLESMHRLCGVEAWSHGVDGIPSWFKLGRLPKRLLFADSETGLEYGFPKGGFMPSSVLQKPLKHSSCDYFCPAWTKGMPTFLN